LLYGTLLVAVLATSAAVVGPTGVGLSGAAALLGALLVEPLFRRAAALLTLLTPARRPKHVWLAVALLYLLVLVGSSPVSLVPRGLDVRERLVLTFCSAFSFFLGGAVLSDLARWFRRRARARLR
jgi:hypothetical protein